MNWIEFLLLAWLLAVIVGIRGHFMEPLEHILLKKKKKKTNYAARRETPHNRFGLEGIDEL